MKQLRMWNYPGNVRELKNIMERAVALCPANIIQVDDLPSTLTGSNQPQADTNHMMRKVELGESGLNLDEPSYLRFPVRKYLSLKE